MEKIFHYLDYRDYLRDYYTSKKKLNPAYSYRMFARLCGFNSSGLVSDIIHKKRKLSQNYIPKFIKGLTLDPKESKYFELLVLLNHCDQDDDKREIQKQLAACTPHKIKQLRHDQVEYFGHWYHIAIREALKVVQVSDQYDMLAQHLKPSITVAQIKKSIQLLHRLNLIEKNHIHGHWQATSTSVWSPAESMGETGIHLQRSFQKQMMELASNALDNVSPQERNISATTMSVSLKAAEMIKQKIRAFHKEIIEIVQGDLDEDRIYQFNVQFFPLWNSQSKDKE